MDQIQYLRKCNLVIADETGAGLDLSTFKISFAIKKTDGQTPNTANIRVYGLNASTMARIQKEFTRVLLQGGYESNYGVLFQGDAKQFGVGGDKVINRYLNIQAADGDSAYNFAAVNATISAGATQRDQIEAAAKVMKQKGVDTGYTELDDTQKLPRGKVMYGMSRDYLRQSTQSSGSSWTIQNGVLQVVPLTGVLPGTAFVLNSKTGLIGRPEQTNTGVKFRCLLNPMIVVGGAVQIAEKDIQQAQLEEQTTDKKAADPVPALASDGFYRVISLEMVGDTRGKDWYCECVGLDIDSTTPKSKSVQAN